ncbi:hypothetical protein A7985_07000 [Pseudoalteromonas luteoviolacea]|uniref:Uncharacterized protein n=1 Tax=Pseudoalteromonas luteoviolacea TaxID=43657 RepID=A0A1C0TWH3_9GAMM|nr:hypothetical protein A7985_07000 [Pseudoalteromonas luteoviolacea]
MNNKKIFFTIALGYLIYVGSLIVDFQASDLLSLIFVSLVYFYCASNIISFFRGGAIRVSMVEKLTSSCKDGDARLMAVIAYSIVLVFIILFGLVKICSWIF